MIINYNDLKSIRNKYKGKNIVFCSGCFDLFHVGHLNFINNAKKCGDILVVAVLSDRYTKVTKGDNRPIINENERSLIIDNLKAVDYTIILNKTEPTEDHTKYPLSSKELSLLEKYMPIIDKLKPNKFFILKEHKAFSNLIKVLVDKNIEIVTTEYTSQISTTALIVKIMNNKTE